MKCNILLKEAINGSIVSPEERAALNAAKPKAVSGYSPKTGVGIDINSKLSTALNKIIKANTRGPESETMFFKPETIKKLLEREGVSAGEIEGSIGDILRSDKYLENGKISIDTLAGAARMRNLKVTDETKQGYLYNDITYNSQGMIPDSKYSIRHLRGETGREAWQNHFENVVNSFGWSRQYEGIMDGRKVWRLDEVQSDFFQNQPPEYLKDFTARTGVSYNDVKKILIVDALDQAIKHGHDTMVIPITRSANYLTGSTDVSKIYRDLNTGILPKIRKELDREGLKLDIKHVIGKETEVPVDEAVRALIGNPKILHEESAYKYARGYLENMDLVLPADIDDLVVNLRNMKKRDLQKFSNDNEDRVSDRFIKTLQEVKKELFNPESFVITIKDKSGKPAIGLSYNSFKQSVINMADEKGIIASPVKEKGVRLSMLLEALDPNKLLDSRLNAYEQFKKLIPNLPPLQAIDLTKFREELYKIDTIPSKQKRGVLSYLDDASKIGPEKVKQMYEDFKRKIPDLPDIYTLGMPTKYRWDALSILSALGLGEAYKNLKGAEDGMQE